MTPIDSILQMLMEKAVLAENKIAMLELDIIQHEKDIANLQRQIIEVKK